MASIKDLYGQFGPDTVEIVERAILNEVNLAPLLARLGLNAPPGINDQHSVLRAFLYRYGITLFLQIVRNNLPLDEVERLKARKLIGQIPRNAGISAPATGHSPGSNPHLPAAHSHGTPPPQSSPLPVNPYITPFPHTPPPTQPVMPQGPPPNLPPGVVWIATSNYSGPDRRNGQDRRGTKQDRRGNVNLILFSNRRFGGHDRRKTVRRVEDRIRMGLEKPSDQ